MDLKNKEPFKERFLRAIHNPFVILGGLIGLTVVILLIFGIHQLLANDNDAQITVTNLDSYINNIPDDLRTDIYKNVFNIAKLNSSELDDSTIANATANIRDNTFKNWYDSKTGIKKGEFIIDIPKISQNYKVQYSWNSKNSEDNSGYRDYINCLKPDEYAYGFYPCLDLYDDLSDKNIAYLENILPYNSYIDSDVAVHVGDIEYTNGGDRIVLVEVNSCGDKTVLNNGLKAFKDYVNQYLNVDDYTYKSADLCDGGI